MAAGSSLEAQPFQKQNPWLNWKWRGKQPQQIAGTVLQLRDDLREGRSGSFLWLNRADLNQMSNLYLDCCRDGGADRGEKKTFEFPLAAAPLSSKVSS